MLCCLMVVKVVGTLMSEAKSCSFQAVYSRPHKMQFCHHFQAPHGVFDHPYDGLISSVLLRLHSFTLRISCYPLAIYHADAVPQSVILLTSRSAAHLGSP